jgi:ABC-type phosphate transport system substrate-binding protein
MLNHRLVLSFKFLVLELFSYSVLLIGAQQIKAQYMQQFQQGDMNYWKKTIATLNAEGQTLNAKGKIQSAERQTPNAEGAMHHRLLAYLSLAFYSISNQQIRNNQNEAAQHFVDLYKLADPANSEAWYFSAILHARRNEKEAAESDLLQATKCGFKEKERMRNQSEFQQIHVAFSKIEASMSL